MVNRDNHKEKIMKRYLLSFAIAFFALASAQASALDIQATYPDKAWQLNKNGSVVLKYDINSDGKAVNINVVSSEPKGFFEKSSIDALKKYKFGKNAAKTDQQVTMKYQKN